jgi:hypothetical protein
VEMSYIPGELLKRCLLVKLKSRTEFVLAFSAGTKMICVQSIVR